MIIFLCYYHYILILRVFKFAKNEVCEKRETKSVANIPTFTIHVTECLGISDNLYSMKSSYIVYEKKPKQCQTVDT